MILRVETSLTLNTKAGHYIKHTAVLEADWDDVISLMAEDSEIEVSDESVKQGFTYLNDLVVETVWNVIEAQLDELEN